MSGRIGVFGWAALAGVLLSPGCASRTAAPRPARIVCPEGVTTTAVVDAAHEVLAGMQFPIEKLDAGQGVVRTRPLRAAQFFEVWRSDNAGAFNTAEANLQSIRRTVEVRVKALERGSVEASTHPRTQCIECDARVERLTLPANEIAGISQAYQMHTQSTAAVQRFEVSPQQRQGMAWIDLGQDPQLAAEVLKRIERRLRRLGD